MVFIIQLCYHETFHSVFFSLICGHVLFLVIRNDFRECTNTTKEDPSMNKIAEERSVHKWMFYEFISLRMNL